VNDGKRYGISVIGVLLLLGAGVLIGRELERDSASSADPDATTTTNACERLGDAMSGLLGQVASDLERVEQRLGDVELELGAAAESFQNGDFANGASTLDAATFEVGDIKSNIAMYHSVLETGASNAEDVC
jgi:hypothetical protein